MIKDTNALSMCKKLSIVVQVSAFSDVLNVFGLHLCKHKNGKIFNCLVRNGFIKIQYNILFVPQLHKHITLRCLPFICT